MLSKMAEYFFSDFFNSSSSNLVWVTSRLISMAATISPFSFFMGAVLTIQWVGLPSLPNPVLLAKMRPTVFKGLFNRANLTFLFPSLVGVITVITGAGIEFFTEFPIVADQSVVAILNGDDTGYPLKQGLVFVSLLVELLLLFADLAAHLVDRHGQQAHFIFLVDFDAGVVLSIGYQPGLIHYFIDGAFNKSQNKK